MQPRHSKIRHIGFIGTGTLTAAVVKSLSLKDPELLIHLSPRSEYLSLALARDFPNVIREESNADVVQRSDCVVLAVRPQQLREALAGISFREEQLVVSFVATVTVADVSMLVAPASRTCRVTPLPMIADRRGPIVVWPAIAEVESLFEGVGDLVSARSEEQMMAFGAAAGLLSTFFEIEVRVCQWLEKAGVSPESASLYVRSMFAALGATARERPDQSLGELALTFETAGGLNEHARRVLGQLGFFEQVDAELDALTMLTLGKKRGL